MSKKLPRWVHFVFGQVSLGVAMILGGSVWKGRPPDETIACLTLNQWNTWNLLYALGILVVLGNLVNACYCWYQAIKETESAS